MADHLERVVAWKTHLIIGTDYCALWRIAEGWLLKGTVVGALEDQRPIRYEVRCDDMRAIEIGERALVPPVADIRCGTASGGSKTAAR